MRPSAEEPVATREAPAEEPVAEEEAPYRGAVAAEEAPAEEPVAEEDGRRPRPRPRSRRLMANAERVRPFGDERGRRVAETDQGDAEGDSEQD